jgi:hypothetical protein
MKKGWRIKESIISSYNIRRDIVLLFLKRVGGSVSTRKHRLRSSCFQSSTWPTWPVSTQVEYTYTHPYMCVVLCVYYIYIFIISIFSLNKLLDGVLLVRGTFTTGWLNNPQDSTLIIKQLSLCVKFYCTTWHSCILPHEYGRWNYFC